VRLKINCYLGQVHRQVVVVVGEGEHKGQGGVVSVGQQWVERARWQEDRGLEVEEVQGVGGELGEVRGHERGHGVRRRQRRLQGRKVR
jgi:hypothetical protein